MRRTAILLMIFATALAAYSIRTSEKLRVAPVEDACTSCPYDTVVAPHPDSIVVAGYDKPLRSRHETFFVTNHLVSDTLHEIWIHIDYYDMEGRALHNRDFNLRVNLAPGETRNFSKRSWDVQNSFYYHRSQKPRRSSSIPYDVKVRIDTATISTMSGL